MQSPHDSSGRRQSKRGINSLNAEELRGSSFPSSETSFSNISPRCRRGRSRMPLVIKKAQLLDKWVQRRRIWSLRHILAFQWQSSGSVINDSVCPPFVEVDQPPSFSFHRWNVSSILVPNRGHCSRGCIRAREMAGHRFPLDRGNVLVGQEISFPYE